MKTNKIWSILAMLVVSVTVMFFTSCSSDDDGDGSKDINVQEVVGTWTCTASTDKVDGKSITGYMVGESITISEDGKFSSTASSIGNGTWELNGNKMSAKNTHGDTFSATLTVKGNTMTWNGTSSQGVSFNYTWQKEASSTDKEIKPEDLIGTWEGIAPSGSSNYSMRFISKSANQYELYYIYSNHDALFMSGNYTLTKAGNEYELKLNSKMHDEWGTETETSMTLKIAWENNLKTAIRIGDNIFNKK